MMTDINRSCKCIKKWHSVQACSQLHKASSVSNHTRLNVSKHQPYLTAFGRKSSSSHSDIQNDVKQQYHKLTLSCFVKAAELPEQL